MRSMVAAEAAPRVLEQLAQVEVEEGPATVAARVAFHAIARRQQAELAVPPQEWEDLEQVQGMVEDQEPPFEAIVEHAQSSR